MIVPMKSVTLLAVAEEEAAALSALRDIGVMQIVQSAKFSSASQSSSDALYAAEQLRKQLEQIAAAKKILPADNAPAAARGRDILKQCAAKSNEAASLNQEISSLKQRLNRLAIWGDFDRQMLDSLKAKGVSVILCTGTADEFKELQSLQGVTLQLIRQTKELTAFAALCAGECPQEVLNKLPVFKLSDGDDPAALRKALTGAENAFDAIQQQLAGFAGELPSIRAACDELAEQLAFDRAADAMAAHGKIAVLQGFVPEPDVDTLRAGAAANGWGLLITDPAEEDNVPVLLKDNRFTRIIKPLFDFLGIVPGYREIDVSGGVLVFFTIFYSIIIGDAGYGLLFTLLSLGGLLAARKRPALKMPMRLLLLLSICTLIWGALCGSWFGLAAIPGSGGKPFPGIEKFRDFANSTAKQANIQFFCFLLAVAQLSCGRIWKAIRERNWRSTAENLGWMLIIWGNFFLTIRLIVYPGDFPFFMYILYGIGLSLVVLFGVKWNSVADVFQFPFNIVGSFTDVLSYIRLFAVSLAGACIASSFNGMAFDVCKASVWLLPAGAIVVLLGHALNIALALSSVLVHAVRLNTLEFSNHTGLSWSGQAFNPFKKTTKNKE